LHATVGGLLSKAMGGDFATGAAAAGANEALMEHLSNGLGIDNKTEQGKRLEQAASQLIGLIAAGLVEGDLQQGSDIAKNATAFNRQMHPDERRLLEAQAKQLAAEQGISEDEAIRRLAEAFVYYTDKDWQKTIAGAGVSLDDATLQHLGTALAPLGSNYEGMPLSDVPVLSVNRAYSPGETLDLLKAFQFTNTESFNSSLANSEYLVGNTPEGWGMQSFYENNLNYGSGGEGSYALGVLKGVGGALKDTVVGGYELGKSFVEDFSGTSSQIANGLLQTLSRPDKVVADFFQGKDDADAQAMLYRLQGNFEEAGRVEANWDTELALNLMGPAGSKIGMGSSKTNLWLVAPEDVRRTYLNENYGRSGDLNLDINVRGNIEIAENFYLNQGWSKTRAESHVAGIDFSRPVDLIYLSPGQPVVQYQIDGRLGNYFAPVGKKVGELGINPSGRETYVYAPMERVLVMRSTASEIVDSWSTPGSPYKAEGGGVQYFTGSPDKFRVIIHNE